MRQQWRVMDNQLEAMREQYTAEKDFMKLQIHNLSDQSDVMGASYELTKQTVKAMQGQLDTMRLQERAMRESLDETRRAIRYSEAAYIAITDASLVQFGEGLPTVCRMFYTNAGNTPAYNVRTYGHINLWERPMIPADQDKLKDIAGVECSQHLIAPSGVRDHIVTVQAPLTALLFQQIEEGKLRFYVWGIITYEDIFGRERWTTFCHMQIGPSTALYGCGSNNDADREGANPN
jgi:hypothetical protein